jgi:3-dehydroquinate dehydratase-2
MGSGKTNVGRKLSYRLRMPVEDTDKLIERKAQKTVSQIFAEDGEEAFRQMETQTLKELFARKQKLVISVGGGTPVRPENQELLKKLGTVIYLRIRPETVYERLKGDVKRPLLQCKDPKQKIIDLMEARKECYELCADIIIDVDELEGVLVVDQICQEIERKKILVINGPNLNFLGIREKHIYGTQNYDVLLEKIEEAGKKLGVLTEVFQSNHEGAIIDRIQEAYFDGTSGIVINPGAYTHYSYAIRDALSSIEIPKIEVHISDITSREAFRKVSVTAEVCNGQIFGKGLDGYVEAMEMLVQGF